MIRPLILSGAALAGALCVPAQAQQVFDLDEIVFSASLSPVARGATGASISVLTRDEIAAAGDATLPAVLGRLPGVQVQQTGGQGGPTSVSIRGASSRYIAVYVDGVLVTDPTQLRVEFDFGGLSARDIDRIEVLRGAQSALYGGSAVGGVISITTTRPAQDGTQQRLRIEGGSYGTLDASYSFARRTGALETSFSLSRFHADGFSSMVRSAANPVADPDAHDRMAARISARYTVSDTLVLGVDASRETARTEFDDEFNRRDADSLVRRTSVQGRVYAEFSLGASTHEISLGAMRVNRAFAEPFRNALFEGQRLTLRYLGTTPLSPGATLSYGFETGREVFKSGFPTYTSRESLRKSGVFAELLWSPREGLDLGAALRVDRDPNAGTTPSGRLSGSWRVSPDLTLRGAVGSGFRAPSMEERFADYDFRSGPPFPSTYYFKGNPNLRPEKSLSAELGADWQASADLRLGATLFYLSTRDAIRGCGEFEAGPCGIALPPGVTASYENLDRIRRQGVELSAEWQIADGHRLNAAYTYTDAEITQGVAAGARLGSLPRHNLALSLESRVTERLTATGNLTVKSDRLARDGGARLASFGVTNVNLVYTLTDAVDLSLRVDNLFDRTYQEVPNFGTSGRAVYVGLASRF